MNRLSVSIGLALAALFGATGVASATPEQPDREEVAIGMFLVALGVMLFLLTIYAIKWYFGIDAELPPEDETPAHH